MQAKMQIGNIAVTLNLLKCEDNDISKGKKGKELGYVQSFSAQYALNSIPSAVLTIPLGSTVDAKGKITPSYAYGNGKEAFMSLADKKSPVGIYVKGRFFDTQGSSSTQEYCVFKGFLVGASYAQSAVAASLQVSLIHWLSDLSTFPLVSSLLSPQTASDVAAQYPLTVSSGEATRMGKPSMQGGGVTFGPVGSAVQMLQEDNSAVGIWDALKEMFIGICPDLTLLKEEDPGYVSKDFLERMQKALDSVVGKDLEFFPDTEEDYRILKTSVSQMLISLSCGYFNGSTIWDKLINTFLPNFYMALVPRVTEANVIPSPGQSMGAVSPKCISRSEYFQTNFSRNRNPLLGGVLLYMDPNIYKYVDNAARCSIRFPEELQPGPLRVVTAPSWLEKGTVAISGTNISNVNNFYLQYSSDIDKKKEAKKEKEDKETEHRNTIERMLKNLVRITYQILVCSERQMSMELPFRIDITPGELLRIELPGGITDDKKNYIYGTVLSVGLSINSGNATTTIVLSNIRTYKEMADKNITSSEGIMFKGAWKSNSKLTLGEEI